MRALTLTQPWAGLVASGIKLVENRPRKIIAPRDFGQPFAIHASRVIDDKVYARIAELAPELQRDEADAAGAMTDEELVRHVPAWRRLSRITSAVIAVATIDSVVTEPVMDASQHRWFFGPVGYVLRDVIALREPVPCRGFQGFWTLPADVEAKVRAQVTPIADLIERSSIGAGLRNIRENGIDAELADIEDERRGW